VLVNNFAVFVRSLFLQTLVSGSAPASAYYRVRRGRTRFNASLWR